MAIKDKYQVDIFDKPDVGKRVGAHRYIVNPNNTPLKLVIAIVSTLILSISGIALVALYDGGFKFKADVPIAVKTTATKLTEEQIKNSLVDSSFTIVEGDNATEETIAVTEYLINKNLIGTKIYNVASPTQQTALYYSTKTDKEKAEYLAAQLGGIPVYLFNSTQDSYDTEYVIEVSDGYTVP